MFRQPTLRLSLLASPPLLMKRGASRHSVRAGQSIKVKKDLPKASWSSSRVFFLASLIGATAYFGGINHDVERFPLPWLRSKAPRYASKTQMEKACLRILYSKCPLTGL